MTAMPARHIPALCPPGTKMLLEVSGLVSKLATACVGYIKGRFVVTTIPVVPEHNRDNLHQMLYPDNGVIVRFLLEGTVMGFSCSVIRSMQVPFPLLFLSYPSALETLELRHHRRVACCIPATAALGKTPLPGMIVDLSRTGCQFSARLEAAQPPQIRVDDSLPLHCPLFGQGREAELPSQIKRIGFSNSRLELGLNFLDLAQTTLHAIDDYLQNALLVLA